MSDGAKVRALAAKTVAAVVGGLALDQPLARNKAGLSEKDQSFLSALCYGTLRRWPRHKAVIEHVLRNPKKPLNPMLQALLAVGLEQMVATRVPEHAAVAATVAASRFVNQHGKSGFLNAILRRFLREREEIEAALAGDTRFKHEHPKWYVDQLKAHWTDHYSDIIRASNAQPPMWLRVNQQKVTRDDYLKLLQEAKIDAAAGEHLECSILLSSAVSVEQLPKFSEGWVSVQDVGAQFAAEAVAAESGMYVLDACAAPGGKTMHMLERQPDLEMLAMDVSADRLVRVKENAERLSFSPILLSANAAITDDWWDGRLFDRILIDAPCTGTGVIRRHPDIKVLRRPKDAAKFALLQQALISALWPTLAPGGRMIYATCSIMPAENEELIQTLIAALPGAQSVPLNCALPNAKSLKNGVQLLPNETGSDGFYYAVLLKSLEPSVNP